MTRRVVFHISSRMMKQIHEMPHLRLYARIEKLMTLRGGTVEVRKRHHQLDAKPDDDWRTHFEPENLHIVENGLMNLPGVLNSTLAYLQPFYHLDPQGVLALSTARNHPNTMSQVSCAKADDFWTELQRRFVDQRYSRYDQNIEIAQDIPDNCLAVFLQGAEPQKRGTAYCDPETMLRTVVKHASGRPVVVKAHPVSNIKAESEMILRLLSEGINLVPTDANIHDILPKCDATISFNSAVALEGFLYHKPAILFGQSDFHHVCETVKDVADFPNALNRALLHDHDYKRFLYWYFTTFCISLQDPDFEPKVLQIFADQGFSADRLLKYPAPPDFHAPAVDKWHAADVMHRYLTTRPEVQSLSDVAPIKVRPNTWVLRATVNGQDVALKRFIGPKPVQKVSDLKGELDTLENHYQGGDCQANRCVMTWPEDGIVALSFAPGERLDRAIAARSGQERADVLTHAGRWLATNTQLRNRQTKFGPAFWMKQMRNRDKSHIQNAADRAMLLQLLDVLHTRLPALRGCPVRQAASHGDFAGINAQYDGQTIYGVDIQGECWTAVAREAARFLVWQHLHDPTRDSALAYGLNASDVAAFLKGGPVMVEEHTTTLPFFIAEQLLVRFVEDYEDPKVQNAARLAIQAYITLQSE